MHKILVGFSFLTVQETPSYRSHLADFLMHIIMYHLTFQKTIVQHRVYHPATYATSELQGMSTYLYMANKFVKY